MASQLFQNYVYNDAGAAVVGATVDLLTRNTTTPVLSTTTTDANGLWTISYATEGRYDVRVTNGSSIRFHKWDARLQMDTLEVSTFRVRNPAFTFDYDIVPAAIVADRQLNLPLITGTDTLAVLGLAQTWTGVQTFGAITLGGVVSGGGQQINNVIIGTVTPLAATFTTVGGTIGTFSGTFYIGDTSNANITLGLTINQGAADNEILDLKSSDVAHGITTITETDTYAFAQKLDATNGGLLLTGLNAATTGIFLRGIGVTDNTTKSTAASAYIRIGGQKKSGTGNGQPGADANLAVIESYNGAAFIFDVEGSAHADVEWVAFDSYDDIALVHDIEQHLLDRESEAGTYNRHALEKAGIIGKDSWHFENARPRAMVNFTKLAMLHHGTLIQVGERFRQLEQKLALAEKKLAALSA